MRQKRVRAQACKVGEKGGGFIATSTVKYAVSPLRGRMPDLTVFLPGGQVPPREGIVTLPPDIAVEVISPTPKDQKRDRVEKLKEYAEFGIKYYWLVDPYLRSFEVLELYEYSGLPSLDGFA